MVLHPVVKVICPGYLRVNRLHKFFDLLVYTTKEHRFLMVFFAKIMPLQGESLKTMTIPKKSAVILFVKELR
jgi:hypothetical protein